MDRRRRPPSDPCQLRGEAFDALRLLRRGLAEPRIEVSRLGSACDGASDPAVAKRAERRILGIRGSAGRHEDVLDQARVAVLDVLDATEQFRDVERLLVHRGHHRHQEIEPLEQAPLRTDGAAEHHAEMRMGIDQPREHDLAGGVDDEIAIRNGIAVRLLDGDDVAALHHHPPVLDDPALAIHRENEPVLDRDARHRQHQCLTGRSLKSWMATTSIESSNRSER